MLIRCWGVRGSIPVSGREYVVYGGDSTCMEIRSRDDKIIIIDSGTGIRRLGNRLLREERYDYTMFLTHAHWDHILGFPFFKPIYMQKTRIRMLGCAAAFESIKNMISGTMVTPHFPVDFDDIKADIRYEESCSLDFTIGSLKVIPIILSHPGKSQGFKFIEDGKTFVYMTDTELGFTHPGGLGYEVYRDFVHGADLLLHDAEYTSAEYGLVRQWGHSTYQDTLRFALDAGVSRLGLLHHNQDRKDSDIERIVEDCRVMIREQHSTLDCFALAQDQEIIL